MLNTDLRVELMRSLDQTHGGIDTKALISAGDVLLDDMEKWGKVVKHANIPVEK
jgi:hypothetical protein